MDAKRLTRRLFAVFALIAFVSACGSGTTDTSTPGPSAKQSGASTVPTTPTAEASPTAEAAPTPSGPTSTAPTIVHGAPLDPGLKPDPAACEGMIRGEHAAAARIRAGLSIDGLHSDIAVAIDVANDPDTTISPTEGIPLTDEEISLIEASHVSGWETPLSLWVEYGAPERFGGFWIEWLSGVRGYVVAIPPADQATLALARCLEPGDAEIRYVQAASTVAARVSICEWIREDREWLRASGIELISTGCGNKEGVIDVGVHDLTPEIEDFLRSRYGWLIQVHEQDPADSWP